MCVCVVCVKRERIENKGVCVCVLCVCVVCVVCVCGREIEEIER